MFICGFAFTSCSKFEKQFPNLWSTGFERSFFLDENVTKRKVWMWDHLIAIFFFHEKCEFLFLFPLQIEKERLAEEKARRKVEEIRLDLVSQEFTDRHICKSS